MNIILNLYPVQSGGGQQVASNFIKVIGHNDFNHNWTVIVGKGSTLDLLATEFLLEEQILRYPYSYLNRLFISNKVKKYTKVNDVDIIFNFTTIIRGVNIPQVVRSVYSNLYFPEINFWAPYSFIERTKRKIKDFFRLRGTLKADGLIFENNSMLERSIELFSYPKEKAIYIAPSASKFNEEVINTELDYLVTVNSFKILYLTSWHLNKNIHVLPYVAEILNKRDVNVKFILTLNSNNAGVKEFLMPKIKKLNVQNSFEFVGGIDPVHVHQIVKVSDAMILLSKLECFSSNIVEAFTFNKPLLISNEKWAKSACKDAGLYVDRNNPKNIAEKIIDIVENESLCKESVQIGKKILESEFNNPEDKVIKTVEFLEYVHNNNKIKK